MPHAFTVSLDNLTNQYQRFQDELHFIPERWSWEAIGGCREAEVMVIGPEGSIHETLNYLGFRIVIRNPDGTPVWYGFINEVEVSTKGILAILSLDNVFNRVAVNYVETQAGGFQSSDMTDFADDAISQANFGVREILLSFEGTQTEAEHFRQKSLVELRNPQMQIRVEPGETGARLHCLGFWSMLEKKYYVDLRGLEENPNTGAGEQYIGASYVASTISFDASDDLYDSAGYLADGFAALEVGDKFNVAGASNGENNGEFTVKSSEDDLGTGHIETVNKDRVLEAEGSPITLSRGGERIDRIAQSFTLTENVASWTVANMSFRVKSVGSPGDNLVCELRSDSGGSPGGVLDTTSLSGSIIPEDTAWVVFTMSNADLLVYGTTYWLVVSRDGSNSLANYYIVDVDEDVSYTGGQVKVYNGTSWSVRDPAADIPFRIEGLVETTVQLKDMIESSPTFGASSVDVWDEAGIDTWQYREGDTLIRDEVDDLLELGTSAEERLLVKVDYALIGTSNMRVGIYKQPVASESDIRLRPDGSLTATVGGQDQHLEPGIDISGQWVILDIPPLQDVLGTRALFVERAEYNVEDDITRVDSQATTRVWDFAKAQQG
jgi:hypothetical protein